MKRRKRFLLMIGALIIFSSITTVSAQQTVKLKVHRFSGDKKDDSMWSGIYTAKSGKIYIGLCTHADAANFYEFDPATEEMVHIADLTIFKGERGKGIRTSGKIHVPCVEDKEGNIYFGDFCEDNGPEPIDPSSYEGAHWFNAKAGRFGDNELAFEEFMKIHEIARDGMGVPVDQAKYIVGPWLEFDGEAEHFIGDHSVIANRLLFDPRRAEFDIPSPHSV